MERCRKNRQRDPYPIRPDTGTKDELVIRLHNTRPAIAMIELIFAIVIMGIALLSAPMLVSQASSSAQTAFQQESIAMLASHTNALLSYAWDERDTASVNNDTILNTGSTIAELNGRLGGVGKLRILPGAPLSATDTGTFGANQELNENDLIDRDDIDDFAGDNASLSDLLPVGNAADGDYMDRNITITTAIQYATAKDSSGDFHTCPNGSGCTYSQPFTTHAAAGTSNIKLIQTTLQSPTNLPGKVIVLRAFMCNIGTAQPRKVMGI